MRLVSFVVLASCAGEAQSVVPTAPVQQLMAAGEGLAGNRLAVAAPMIFESAALAKLAAATSANAAELQRVAAQGARPIRVLSTQEAVRCGASGVDCSVADGGLFVRIDSSSNHAQRLTLYVTFIVGEVRPSGARATCTLPVRLLFDRQGDKWQAGEPLPSQRC